MKKLKKLLSLLLTFVLLLASVPANVLAGQNPQGSTAAKDVIRYNVLILDTSGSMSGQPIKQQTNAAKKFCESVINAEGENHVAIVKLGTTSQPIFRFEDESKILSGGSISATEETISDTTGNIPGKNQLIKELQSVIDNYASSATSSTNTNMALEEAEKLLSGIDDGRENIIKNIILCSDGLPQTGTCKYDGPYYESDIQYYYPYASACYSTAREKLDQYNIYTLGFFHSLENDKETLTFAQKFMDDLANKESYMVTDSDNLEFVFGEISGTITTGDTDPVIIVPDIMGSRLFTDETCTNKIWEPDIKDNGIIKDLKDWKEAIDIKNTIYVKPCENQRVLNESDREYGTANLYKNLVDSICTQFSDRDVYFFNYDWRQSNADNAGKLKECIETITSSDDVKKVDLVCHSMGGLIASKCYSDYSNDDGISKIHKIVTCGTPYEGEPKIINSVQNWDTLGKDYIFDDNIFKNLIVKIFGILNKDMKSSFPSFAELTPTKNYVSEVPMQLKSIKSLFGHSEYKDLTYDEYCDICKTIFSTNYEDAKNFQSSITGTGTNCYNALLNYSNAYFMLGVNHKTISSIKYTKIGEKYFESDIEYDAFGDGTVPYFSSSIAKQIEKISERRWAEFDADHEELISNTDCLEWINNKLLSDKTETPEITPGPYLVVRIACPVDVSITKDGQTLSYQDGTTSPSTDFGRMDVLGENDEIKLACIDSDPGSGYKVNLEGTGEGKMNYSVRLFDPVTNTCDERIFEGVPITKNTDISTAIKTDASGNTVSSGNNSGEIVLNVDGKTWTAAKGEWLTVPDDKRVPLESISLEPLDSNIMLVDETRQLELNMSPSNTTDKALVQYESTDSSVVSVSKDGTLKAEGEGTATVTGIAGNGLKTQSVAIIVQSKDNLNTGIYEDSSGTTLADSSNRTLYANGGNVKQENNTKYNFKSRTLYTTLKASDINSKDKKGKTKTKKGKLVAGLTSSYEEPEIVNGKIKDAEAAKTASVSIRNGQIKIKAKNQPGNVYLWVKDTGDAHKSVCAAIKIKAAPSKMRLFNLPSSSSDFSDDNKNVYKKDTIELGSSKNIYVYPTYKVDKTMTETKNATYSVSVSKNAQEYFTATKNKYNPNCFTIRANKLKNGKKVSGKITVTCDQNGKKATFTATAANSVKNVKFNTFSGMLTETSDGMSITRSETNKTTGSFALTITNSSSQEQTTDKPRLYAMGTVNGFDTAAMTKGKVKIISKPDKTQKQIKATLSKDKKTVNVTANKNIPAGTAIYYMIYYNNGTGGYKVVKITAN